MRILLTGGAGYIGSKLVPKLLSQDYEVTVLDSLLFGGQSLSPFSSHPGFKLIQGDIRDRDIIYQVLDKINAVIHLAANVTVSGSESVSETKLIVEINYLATCHFVDLCKEKQVERFIFTSTCSNYGISETTKYAIEEDVLKPTSPYTESKVRAEEYILSSADAHFHPTVLRLATVFGVSPRMSFQSLFHALVRDAVVNKSLSVYGANSWRPFIHIEDVIQAILLVVQAPLEPVSGQVFNVGSNALNCQKIQLVNVIKKCLPETEIEIKGDIADPRSYQVSFDKITRVLGFKATKTIEEGVAEVKEVIERDGL